MKTKRILSILLAVAMVITLIPATALADIGEARVHDHDNVVVGAQVKIEANAHGNIISPGGQTGSDMDIGDVWTFTADPDPGYKFDKWTFSGSELPGSFSSSTNPILTVTISRGWYNWSYTHYKAQASFVQLPQYTLTANNNGQGSITKSPDSADNKYYEGTSVTLTANPASGWEFAGWSDGLGSNPTITVNMSSDKTVTANYTAIPRYTLDVTISGQGSVTKNPTAADYLRGEHVDITAVPDPGWKFDGWSGDASGKDISKNVVMNGNKSITATFTALPTYTLTTNVNPTGSGSVSKNPDVASYWQGRGVTLTANAAAGYRFGSWSGDVTGSDNPKTFSMDGNKNVTANFIKTYNITLNTNGNGHFNDRNAVAGTHDDGTPINLNDAKPDPDNDFFSFLGWQDSAGNFLSSPTFTLTGDCTFTAVFTEKDHLSLTAGDHGYLANDISGHYAQGTPVNLNDSQPTGRAGYTLDHWEEFGWMWTGSGTDVQLVGGQPIISIGESNWFKAFFKVAHYSISYDLDGGAVSPDNPASYTYFDPSFTLRNPSRTGYTFAGWSGTGITGMSTNVTIPNGSTGDRTYTANWTANTYTVAYNANGGTGTMTSDTYTYDSAQKLKKNTFINNGWAFDGWATSSDGPVVYSDEQSVKNLATSGTVTLYAKWAIVTYNINYDLDGGSASGNPSTYTITSSAITLSDPAKTGYTFLGWTGTGVTVNTKPVVIPTGSFGDRDYVAHWQANTYTVTYHANGGTGDMSPSTHTYDTGSNLTKNAFVRTSCKFVGWARTAGGAVEFADEATVKTLAASGNADLYAKWEIINVSVSDYNNVYDGASHGVNVTGVLPTDTVTYSTDGGVTYDPAEPTYKNVAESGATVYVKVVRAGTPDFIGSAKVIITTAALTVTADGKSVTYGDAAPEYTVSFSGFASGENKGVLGGTLALDCSYAAGSPVSGSPYTITPSGYTSGNYNITFVPGTLTVAQKALTITADNKSVTYGDAAPGYTVSYDGFVLGQDKGVLGGTLALDCSYAAGSPVSGSPYAITPGGYTSDNYDISFVPGTLTVAQKALAITADNKTVTYGDAVPGYTVSYDGFVLGQDETALGGTLALDCSYAAGSPVSGSPYAITPSGYTSGNYDITFVPGALTVDPKALTITADNKAVLYGAAAPSYTVTYDGFVTGEDETALGGTLALDSAYAAGSDTGTYPITAGGLTSTNYDVTFAPGTLTVGKAPLTVTAEDKTVTFLDAAPAYTVKYAGFVAGDTAAKLGGAVAYKCSYAAGSAVGTYAITPSGLTSKNYDIAFKDGTLTVNTLMLNVTFQDFNGTTLGTSTVAYGTPAVAPANPSREGYTFTGWSTTFNNVTSTITVTAQYTINTYTVRFFEMDGVTEIGTPQTINWDGAATFRTAPGRAGYAFDEWVLTGDSAAYADSLTHVKENINAVASYTRDGYTVTFLDYNGNVIGTDGVLYGQGAQAPTPPTRDGYTFTGWDREFNPVTGNISVTAQYQINAYTVMFADFDGTVLDTQTVNYNTGATAPAAPTRDGYTFTGWDNAFDAVTSDITVTAQYEQNAAVQPEGVPQTGTNIPDEPVPSTGGNAFAWWWIVVIVLGAGLLFFLIFFVWKRRRKEEKQ